MVGEKQDNSTVFDHLAAEYDGSFSNTDLGRMLRRRVWRHLREQFQSDQKVLDIACGTGEDALWLAQQSIYVTAIDGSSEMVRIAASKAEYQAHQGEIIVRQFSLQDLIDQPQSVLEFRTDNETLLTTERSPDSDIQASSLFDGAVSNFGGLNVVDSWSELAGALAHLIRVGGKVVLVPMGTFCPWEIAWHLVHLDPRTAFRRFARKPVAKIGDREIPVYYPSRGQLAREFQPWFDVKYSESLGFLLPTTSLPQLVVRRPRFFHWLNGIERRAGRMTFGWGDHFILILERNETLPGT